MARRIAGAEAGVNRAVIAGALRPWLVLALVCGGFSLHPAFARTFWDVGYLPVIGQQAATTIILAVGMTFVIMTGGIDLSVGSVLALCGVTLGLCATGGVPRFVGVGMALPAGLLAAAALARWVSDRRLQAAVALAVSVALGLAVAAATAGGTSLPVAILAALSLGLGCGLINGLGVSLGRVPPFVVTLGMYTAARGLAVHATDGQSVSVPSALLSELGRGWPVVLLSLAAVALGVVVLRHTRAGRYLQAIGGNEEAARLSGVDLARYKTLAYMLSGLTAALAAVVVTAKFRLADTGAGSTAELNAIAAVVIGGTPLSGGSGSVVGSLVGALTIAVLNAGLVLVGVKDTLQGVVIGAVIVLAVMVDQWRGA